MLPDRLARLDGAGVVEHDRRPGRPPRVRYDALTLSGHRLGPVLRALRNWGRRPRHKTAELRAAARQALFADRPTSRLTCGNASRSHPHIPTCSRPE
ncbi:winged helix-turn-helix transcriptional regulator [Streptomyces sp. NPDC013433]|uniref:winged helix-turn-helix transcriptional regulator n=1 Tax=Streptomyces sp. NPDC013433 TaxID=3155604 RepID=UPI003451904A